MGAKAKTPTSNWQCKKKVTLAKQNRERYGYINFFQ